MSNKSGASAQVISLPQGGGALKGIGETFSPDLQTGTGNFSVPIALPPGRNGFQPSLSLGYSTGNGNGAFGLGWQASVPGVMRKTSKGIPRYQDSEATGEPEKSLEEDGSDTFVLSGAEDLVLVEEILGIRRYRPRTEGLFARIERYFGGGQDYWKVWSKDGLVSYYGTPRPTGAGADWQDPAAITDPDNRQHIFAWKLSKTVDTFGNLIEYVYERDFAEVGPRRWAQLYLKHIRYVDYQDEKTGATQFLVSVEFDYQARPDSFSGYRAGFEVRTRKRCQQIKIFTHPAETLLVRSYQLVYLDERPALASRLSLNGVSLLSQINVIGHDGDKTEVLPPLEFGYTKFDPKGRDFFPLSGPALPAQSLASPDLELADLFGNGLPDILEMNGTVRYWKNLGNGRFDRPREMRTAPAGVSLADAGVQLMDANGDGRIDLLVTTGAISGYYPTQPDGSWDRRSFQRYDKAPSFNLEAPDVQLVDLTGDGVIDAIRSGSRLECFFNDPDEGWTETRFVPRRAIEDFPNVDFSDSRVKWGDMSGDGLQDIVLVHDGNIEYWPNLGYGNWGKRISMRNGPRYRYGYDPRRILIGDVDGDGLADVVYVDDRKVIVWINQSGNGWSDPIEIKGTPAVSDLDSVRLVDLLGTGVGGILWSADASLRSRNHLYFLDFTGGIKPYVMTEMDNHMGAVTRVQYVPSTKFYLEDERSAKTRWKTTLPFPVQVVAKVEVIDELSKVKLTTQYLYHHGYWDGWDREFRGFGRVEQIDTETFEAYNGSSLSPEREFNRVATEQQFSPPTLTKTWFHLGPVADEGGDWQELDYSGEYWDGGALFSRQKAFNVPNKTTTLSSFEQGTSAKVKRDMLRTVRGQTLRSEVFALDVTEDESKPYTVTSNVLQVSRLPLQGQVSDLESWQYRVFYPFVKTQWSNHFERGEDPKSKFQVVDVFDDYGQVRESSEWILPRGWITPDGQVNFGNDLIKIVSVNAYAQRDDDRSYIVDRVCQSSVYESSQLISQTLNFYDGEAFEGLALGEIGARGALMRSESLVLTPQRLAEIYTPEGRSGPFSEIPKYLTTISPDWNEEYPEEFRSLLQQAGYRQRTVSHRGVLSGDMEGVYTITEQRQYDFQLSEDGIGQGLVLAMRDPLNHETRVTYDSYNLLPLQVTDAIGLTTEAIYDYRVLQPQLATDPNGNRQSFGFTPLGLPDWVAVMGKVGEAEGDTEAAPGTRFEYDFLAFERSTRGNRQPISVRAIKREHHIHEADVTDAERDATIETVEYSDGFGRLLQTRTQAEDITFGDESFGNQVVPADQRKVDETRAAVVGRQRQADDPMNVVVSGWQVYDNKGQVVEKYEPFYAQGWAYTPPQDRQMGQKVTMYYDPLGRAIRTVNPDGSEQRIVYGVPDDIANPEQYQPTPWEMYTYDSNDNAGRTHGEAAAAYQHHWNTPASVLINALGHTIKSIERNGPNPQTDWYTTRSSYDILGNLLTVTDALGRLSFRYTYDFANNPLRIENIDAGVRQVVLDAAGNEIERRDSKGALILQAYDSLNRPVRMWARDGRDQSVTLRERLIYGDNDESGLSREAAQAVNLVGQSYRHYDEAGLLAFPSYDFKGNLLEKERRVLSNEAIEVFPAVDWDRDPSTLLEETVYETSMAYDALNRMTSMRYPRDVEGKRQELRPEYNRAGALEKVALDGQPYVHRIAYNAKGQRSLIAYGNGVMTRYAYNAETFRLVRLYTTRYEQPDEQTYQPKGVPLQDMGYGYDLGGNILAIQDRAPRSGVTGTLQGSDALERQFTYDPLYRLLSATGRESKGIGEPRPWMDDPREGLNQSNHGVPTQNNAPNQTQLYREEYSYDPAGNMQSLRHFSLKNSGWQVSWTRNFGMSGLASVDWDAEWQQFWNGNWQNSGSNRLTHVEDRKVGASSVPTVNQSHWFDVNGNLIQEQQSHFFEWNHSDQLNQFRVQAGNRVASVHVFYCYDSAGKRIKKLVKKGNRTEVTVYVGDLFECHQIMTLQKMKQNSSLHVMDDQQRIVLLRVGKPFDSNVQIPAIQYYLVDHLGSSEAAVNETGDWVNREEFFPFGETSFGSFKAKRYRYSAKERDDESNLYCYGLRYYSPYTARWISPDPLNRIDGTNLFLFSLNNPINYYDELGLQSKSSKARHSGENPQKKITFNLHYVNKAEARLGKDVVNHSITNFKDMLNKELKKEIPNVSFDVQRGGELAESPNQVPIYFLSGGESFYKEMAHVLRKRGWMKSDIGSQIKQAHVLTFEGITTASGEDRTVIFVDISRMYVSNIAVNEAQEKKRSKEMVENLADLLLHEAGHSLGIVGHHDVNGNALNDAMNPRGEHISTYGKVSRSVIKRNVLDRLNRLPGHRKKKGIFEAKTKVNAAIQNATIDAKRSAFNKSLDDLDSRIGF